MTTYDLTTTTPTSLKTGDIINCPYSGTYKSVTLPRGTYKLECWGAQGGSYNTTYYGGKGGYSYGTLTLGASSTTLYVYAGGQGAYHSSTTNLTAGGFNGGGSCYSGSSSYPGTAVTGGGGSDFRIGTDSLYARVIVAGGGGGGNYYSSTYANDTTSDGTYAGIGGYGGGTSGQGRKYSTSTSYFSGGGTQTAGGVGPSSYNGSFGTGNTTAATRSAGGGGGWYGGSPGRRVGGGGGSGYVYTSSTASNYPSGCLLDSSHYLANASTKAGNTSFTAPGGSSETGHSGNGYCRITVISIEGGRAPQTVDLTTSAPTSFVTGDILNCPYSGTAKSVTLPPGIYKLECWGAQGGTYSSYYGGAGGYSTGKLTLTANTTLFIYTGGQPAAYTDTSSSNSAPGGFNGGGTGKGHYYSGTYSYGQGGGGGSDIRIGSDSLYARVIVAGGGGGSSSYNELTYAYGGGTSGGSYSSALAATQTAAGTNGSFGQGSNQTGSYNYKYGAGGGGGGWYGGGTTNGVSDSSSTYRRNVGGGSGYVYTSSTASNYPSGCLLNSTYYLTEASTVAGNTPITSPDGVAETGHTGNGYVRITIEYTEASSSLNLQVKIGTAWKECESVHVNVGGSWKEVESIYVNIGGSWKECS